MSIFSPAPHIERLPEAQIDSTYKRLRHEVFAGTFIGYATFYLIRQNFSLAVPYMIAEYGYTKADLGIVMTILSVAYGVSKFVMGNASDRSNPKYFSTVGLLLSALDPLNLTYTQYIVMMALWQYGDLSVKELGQVLRLDSGTLTPLLKKLEAKAFLKRKRSRQDERVVMVTLTDTGKALRDEAVHIPRRLSEAAGPIFDVEETRQLRMLLNKLLEAIDNANARTAEKLKR